MSAKSGMKGFRPIEAIHESCPKCASTAGWWVKWRELEVSSGDHEYITPEALLVYCLRCHWEYEMDTADHVDKVMP